CYLAEARHYEGHDNFKSAGDMYKAAGDQVNVRRCYFEEARHYEELGYFKHAADMYEGMGNKEMSLFMHYIFQLEIDSESRTLLQQHKYVEGLQSLLNKELISEEVLYLFMFDGKSPVSLVRDRRRFGRGQSAPEFRRRATEKKETKWGHGKIRMVSAPDMPHADVEPYDGAGSKDRLVEEGSSKEPKDEE
ncbi:hypothetical protein EBQ93_00240, partial [bacterium]|nr:hypothetical protein [bacterium]